MGSGGNGSSSGRGGTVRPVSDRQPLVPPDIHPGSFLALLTEDERETLAAHAKTHTFPRGFILLHAEEISTTVALLTEGYVKISYSTDHLREVILAIRGPGDLIGNLFDVHHEAPSLAVIALDQVEAMLLSAADFRGFLLQQPSSGEFLLQTLSRRLRDADERRVELSMNDSVQRVARVLEHLSDRFGEFSKDGIRIALPLSPQDLAAWAGITREALNKALQLLHERGVIEDLDRGITVFNLKALRGMPPYASRLGKSDAE